MNPLKSVNPLKTVNRLKTVNSLKSVNRLKSVNSLKSVNHWKIGLGLVWIGLGLVWDWSGIDLGLAWNWSGIRGVTVTLSSLPPPLLRGVVVMWSSKIQNSNMYSFKFFTKRTNSDFK